MAARPMHQGRHRSCGGLIRPACPDHRWWRGGPVVPTRPRPLGSTSSSSSLRLRPPSCGLHDGSPLALDLLLRSRLLVSVARDQARPCARDMRQLPGRRQRRPGQARSIGGRRLPCAVAGRPGCLLLPRARVHCAPCRRGRVEEIMTVIRHFRLGLSRHVRILEDNR